MALRVAEAEEGDGVALLVVGVVLLVSGAIYEMFTGKSPILPPRLFKTRTTAAVMFFVFIHAFVFFSASFSARA